jgi:hypothetical protein
MTVVGSELQGPARLGLASRSISGPHGRAVLTAEIWSFGTGPAGQESWRLWWRQEPMAEFTDKKTFDRRGFLKGSALFAAAALGVAATVAPAFAQDAPAQNKPSEDAKKDEKKDDSAAAKDAPKDGQPAGQTAEKQDPNKLYDKSGREYRVCERCGGNMYQEGNTWTCEQCGLSYSE